MGGKNKGNTKRKSFSLKSSNAEKIEKTSFDRKIAESTLVDEMVEGLDDGSE